MNSLQILREYFDIINEDMLIFPFILDLIDISTFIIIRWMDTRLTIAALM